MDASNHFTVLVYPFRYENGNKSPRHAWGGNWEPWWSRFPDQREMERVLDDTYFFLPHLRDVMFPDRQQFEGPDADARFKGAASLCSQQLEVLREKVRQAPPEAVIRLTHSRRRGSDFLFTLEKQNFTTRLRLCWVDAVLFPQGIGFLLLKVKVAAASVSVDHLREVLHYLRNVHKPTIDWDLPVWVPFSEEGPSGPPLETRTLVDQLLHDLYGGDASVSTEDTLPYSETDEGQIYGQVLHQYTYAQLDGRDADGRADLPAEHNGFQSGSQRALYELVTATNTTVPDFQPHPAHVGRLLESGHIAIWANWEAMAIEDNVVFVGTRPDPFVQRALPHNVESDYLHVYLIALYQKICLNLLSRELMGHGATLTIHLEEAREVIEQFARFRTHYWFPEVSARPQGNELYRSFQKGLNLIQVYESVRSAVNELGEYYEKKHERQDHEALKRIERVVFTVLPVEILADLSAHHWHSVWAHPEEAWSSSWADVAMWGVDGVVLLGLFYISKTVISVWREHRRARQVVQKEAGARPGRASSNRGMAPTTTGVPHGRGDIFAKDGP